MLSCSVGLTLKVTIWGQRWQAALPSCRNQRQVGRMRQAGRVGFDGRHELYEAGGEAAVVAVEVGAGSLLAGGREAEDLGGWDRCRHGEELVGDRNRFFNPRNARFFRIRRIWQHDAEGHASGHGGLRAGAQGRRLAAAGQAAGP